jgi:hypothetical protein
VEPSLSLLEYSHQRTNREVYSTKWRKCHPHGACTACLSSGMLAQSYTLTYRACIFCAQCCPHDPSQAPYSALVYNHCFVKFTLRSDFQICNPRTSCRIARLTSSVGQSRWLCKALLNCTNCTIPIGTGDTSTSGCCSFQTTIAVEGPRRTHKLPCLMWNLTICIETITYSELGGQ